MPNKRKVHNTLKFIQTLLVSVFILSFVFNSTFVNAAILTDGSLTMSDPRINQSNVTYTFDWAGFSGTALQCIQIEFSTASDGSGGIPSGLSSTSATFTSSTLVTSGNWSLNNGTNGTLTLTHNSASEAPSATGNLVFDGLVNGENSTSYFAKIFTYSDACTTEVDSGIIAYTYTDGQLVTLSVDPQITFAITGLTDGQVINGAPQTTITTTDGTVPFGTLTASGNEIGGHALNVSTNALNGYDVSIKYTGPLAYGGATIEDHIGTNASPSSFPAAGTEAFGYTSDATTGGFASNSWAAFTETFETIASSSGATDDTFNVAYQVGVATTTEAGTYSTTIVYQATPTY